MQWHPENLVAERKQKALFEAFLDACRARARATGRAGDPLVFVSLEGPLAVVKLARPAAGNAFAGDMAEMLADTVAALAEDPTVPAIVLTGLGDAFSRGLDPDLLAALVALGDEEGFASQLDALARAARALASAPRPILAAVDGPAFGAGFSLALACDQRIARGSPPHEAAFGLSPFFPALEAGASVFLPLLASPSAAADVAFSGETLSAARARELGLVDLVAEDGPALPLALQRAAQYAETADRLSRRRQARLASRDRLAAPRGRASRERGSPPSRRSATGRWPPPWPLFTIIPVRRLRPAAPTVPNDRRLDEPILSFARSPLFALVFAAGPALRGGGAETEGSRRPPSRWRSPFRTLVRPVRRDELLVDRHG